MATAQEDWQLENLRGAIQLGGQTIKSLELINGGAAIGILTFYGNLLSKNLNAQIDKVTITAALCCFGAGVVCAAMAGGLGYISQLIVAVTPTAKSETLLRYIAIFAGFASVSLFATGVVLSGMSFK